MDPTAEQVEIEPAAPGSKRRKHMQETIASMVGASAEIETKGHKRSVTLIKRVAARIKVMKDKQDKEQVESLRDIAQLNSMMGSSGSNHGNTVEVIDMTMNDAISQPAAKRARMDGVS